MGNLAFDISKIVNLDKTVTLDIDKNVDVNVNIDDLLATAEAEVQAWRSKGELPFREFPPNTNSL